MKKSSVSLAVFSLAVCLFSMPVCAEMRLVKVLPSKPVPKQPAQKLLPIQYLLTQALDAHTLLNQVNQLKQTQEDFLSSHEDHEQAKKSFEELTKCNENLLADQFKNPEAAWKKITDTYDAREKELAIYINSAEPTSIYGVQKEDGSFFSDQEVAEMMIHWSLGNEILTDVYANQDKYGERKNPKAPSFPLWNDQKYFFDKDWDDYYTKLNLFFGVPPKGRPIIDDRKYDYNQAEETLKAHNVYLKMLTAKSPERALLMPEALKKGPQMAPRPLPPMEESVLFLGHVEQTHQVFPAWPEPWQKQIANNFEDVNLKGEMAKAFIPRTFQLKADFEQEWADRQNNRLNVYQLEKKKVDDLKKVAEAHAISVKSAQMTVQNGLDRLNINLSADTDLTQKQNYETMTQSIKDKRDRIISDIEKRLTDAPAHYDVATVIKALKKDTTGMATISMANAIRIDQMLLEKKAEQALLKEKRDFAKRETQKSNKGFNEKCLPRN